MSPGTLKPKISFEKAGSDADVVELAIEVCDGRSLFSNRVYSGHPELEETVKELKIFREQIHGGIYDFRLGAFGPEYAGGAFEARLFRPLAPALASRR